MPRKLKVFRTPTGFHDAYVAATSRKAALAAWGADADLFARGVADEVTDPRLTKEPLDRPGEVIRLSRGDLATQLKALEPRKKQLKPGLSLNLDTKPPLKTAKPGPPPKRDSVDAAEIALREARRQHETETRKLEAERDAVERKLAALRTKQDKKVARLERARDRARAAYRMALDKWSE